MMNRPTDRRLPAEWEPAEAILIAWPHKNTDWAYMLDEVEQCYTDIARAITRFSRLIVVTPEPDHVGTILGDIPDDRITILKIDTNDTWARDFGAITTFETTADGKTEAVINDFKFNGWGLKFASALDNLITLRMTEAGIFSGNRRNRLGFVLEGGSVESDGRGLILTTSECLLSPNRNGQMDRNEIEEYLKDAFGAVKVLWLDHGALQGDDTDSHIDTLARLAPDGDVIFYTGCADPDDEHYRTLKDMESQLKTFTTVDGKPFHLVELPLPDPIYDADEGIRLPATYANFLIVNGAVLLPVYGQPLKDRQAMDTLRVAMPEYEIVPVDCRALIRQHGSLHCITMQFPAGSTNI